MLQETGFTEFGGHFSSCAALRTRLTALHVRYTRLVLRKINAGLTTACACHVCARSPQLSVPVFSLATVNEDGSTNMNIVTYASPVGIKPERLWMVSLYRVREGERHCAIGYTRACGPPVHEALTAIQSLHSDTLRTLGAVRRDPTTTFSGIGNAFFRLP